MLEEYVKRLYPPSGYLTTDWRTEAQTGAFFKLIIAITVPMLGFAFFTIRKTILVQDEKMIQRFGLDQTVRGEEDQGLILQRKFSRL